MSIEKEKLLETLSKALRIEEEGFNFYGNIAVKVKNVNGKGVILGLANDEMKHVDRIKKIYLTLEQGLPTFGIFEEKENLIENIFDDIKVHEMALEVERNGHEFYIKLAQEESELQETKAYLEDPAHWYVKEERHIADAG